MLANVAIALLLLSCSSQGDPAKPAAPAGQANPNSGKAGKSIAAPNSAPAGQAPSVKVGEKGAGKKALTPEEKEEAKKEAERVRAERYKRPVVEVMTPPDPKSKDGAALFNSALEKAGYKTYEGLKSIQFTRSTIQWREGNRPESNRAEFYSAMTIFKPGSPLVARTSLKTNPDEHNRNIPFFAVVNGDDRFEQRILTVLSKEYNEKDAVATVTYEVFYLLAPFVLAESGAAPEYLGKSTLTGFNPKAYDDEKLGWTEYEPVTAIYDVLRFKVPEPYAAVAGPTVDLYLEAGSGKIAMLAAQDLRHPENFGSERMLYEYAETKAVGGIVLPTRIRSFLDFDAYRLETTDFSDYVLDVEIDPKLLKRP